MILAGGLHQPLAVIRSNIGRIHHRELSTCESLFKQIVERVERMECSGLIVLIITHKVAEEIGRQNLCREKMLTRERGLTGAGRAYERNQR